MYAYTTRGKSTDNIMYYCFASTSASHRQGRRNFDSHIRFSYCRTRTFENRARVASILVLPPTDSSRAVKNRRRRRAAIDRVHEILPIRMGCRIIIMSSCGVVQVVVVDDENTRGWPSIPLRVQHQFSVRREIVQSRETSAGDSHSNIATDRQDK